VKFVVPDVVVFIRPKKPASFENSISRQEQPVLYDAMSYAGVVWCAARGSAMASSVVDAAAGGWQKA